LGNAISSLKEFRAQRALPFRRERDVTENMERMLRELDALDPKAVMFGEALKFCEERLLKLKIEDERVAVRFVHKLIGKVCARVVQELEFSAKNSESAGCYRDAYCARRQAERFAARFNQPSEPIRSAARRECRLSSRCLSPSASGCTVCGTLPTM
jgi:hypothetical protein